MTTATKAGARLILALFTILAPAQAARADDVAILRAAWDRAEARDYDEAAALAERARDPVVRDLVRWRRLLRGDGDFSEMRDHLETRPDWAGRAIIRREAERAMPPLPASEVLAFFDGDPPMTGSGAIRLAEALTATDRRPAADAEIARAWRDRILTREERERIEAGWPAVARRHAEERLDAMLWRGEAEQARAVLPLVSPGWRALAEARIALRDRRPGVDGLIARVPAALADDPGLAYERFLWRDRAGRTADAEALLAERSRSAESLGRPDIWAPRRAVVARRAFREGRARDAYRAASAHRSDPSAGYGAYADLEWLSGWIALSGLGDAATAERHFRAFREAVETPISVGRAGYWLGRALEAQGKDPGAAYAEAAQHPTSFYGQLAAERIGRDPSAALAVRDGARDWRAAPLHGRPTERAILLMAAAGHGDRARWFLTEIAEDLDSRDELAALGALALAVGRPDAAIRIGKTGAGRGDVVMDIYYPVTELADARGSIEPALAKAVARQESELNPAAVSPAGARGVMQLMPGTARLMAGELGLPYRPASLTEDPAYNARLGMGYMARMLRRYDGAAILAVAAYNAGPSRVDDWLVRLGDPRRGVDPIDWIESIPFTETRNYVQRVMEGLHVYRARLGADRAASMRAALTRLDG